MILNKKVLQNVHRPFLLFLSALFDLRRILWFYELITCLAIQSVRKNVKLGRKML